jgi:hypothetical protein
MAYRNSLMKKLNLSKSALKQSAKENAQTDENDLSIADIMLDARYLRQSSSLINDALQKGFDVLQLSDGSIVMTGTKTIVHRYQWDQDKGKLAKTKTETSMPGKPSMRKKSADAMELDDEDMAEDA